MPAVNVETAGIEGAITWASDLKDAFTQAAADEVEAESEALQVNVEAVMPVDTGWARGRWGDPGVPGGVWEVSDNGLTIEQGSDLQEQLGLFEYIVKLNEGSSKQAPAGFLDAEAERSGERLEERLNEIADMVE